MPIAIDTQGFHKEDRTLWLDRYLQNHIDSTISVDNVVYCMGIESLSGWHGWANAHRRNIEHDPDVMQVHLQFFYDSAIMESTWLYMMSPGRKYMIQDYFSNCMQANGVKQHGASKSVNPRRL